MLLVKTKIGPSQIDGIGLFADEFIPRGTIIWRFTPGFDLRFTLETLANFPRQVQEHIYKYGWKSARPDHYCHASDHAKVFNHAESPNALSEHHDGEEEVITVALRDIERGEEITDDYSAYTARGSSLSAVAHCD